MWGRFKAQALFVLVCFFLSEPHNYVYLTHNSLTFSETAEMQAAGVNSSTHNPNGVRVHASEGTVAWVFNASLRGGMGTQSVSGSGHIQYGGITPGSSEEMRTLALSRTSRTVDKNKIARAKGSSRCRVCPVDSPRRRSEILEKMEDSKGIAEE